LGFAGFLGGFVVIIDRYLIAAYRSVAEVGFYDVAYSMIAAVLPFSTALLTTMMPRIIKQDSKLQVYYAKISQANTILLTALGLIFFYYSDIIVNLLLGSSFSDAVLPFKILALSLPLMALYSLNVYSAIAMGRTKIAGLSTSLLTVLSFAFNIFLVPMWGASGASWANFLTYAFTSSIGFYYLKTRYGTKISHVLPQYAVFLAFLALYQLLFTQGGFAAKTIGLASFVLVSYLVNKHLVNEILSQVNLTSLLKRKL
jgi:PST family polysaccharide transporter